MYQHTGFLSNIKDTCTPTVTSKDMAPTRDEHEREIATAEAAAIGYSKTFRFRSVKERGASGRTYPGCKLESRSVEACSLSRQVQFPPYLKASNHCGEPVIAAQIWRVFSGFGDVALLPIERNEA